MPWSEKQIKTFRALEHGWNPDDPKLDSLKKLGHDKLKKMAHEGVRVNARKPEEPFSK